MTAFKPPLNLFFPLSLGTLHASHTGYNEQSFSSLIERKNYLNVVESVIFSCCFVACLARYVSFRRELGVSVISHCIVNGESRSVC